MRRLGARSVMALVAGIWLGCGGAEFIPAEDGGAASTTTSGAGGALSTSAGTGTSSGSTDTSGVGGAGPVTTGVGSSASATGAGGAVTATATAGPSTGSGGLAGTGGMGGAGTGGKATGGRAGSGGAGGGMGGATVDAGRDSGSGGSAIMDASRDAPSTCSGSVAFHMKAGNGKSSDYCVGANCSNVWVTVTTSSGAAITFTQGCAFSCSDCQPVACPPIACALPQPMKADGETYTWDGTTWDPGMCGMNTSCRARHCAAPGKYVAKMCASRSVTDGGPLMACNPQPMLTCVDVPFDYPSGGIVEGVIN